MPEDDRNCQFVDDINDSPCRGGCGCGRGCNSGCGCGGNNSTILWFLIIFLLLFTDFGARG